MPDKPVLKGLDVAIHAGEMVGLVGRSGVGKTTMTNLICRFYDVDEGCILLDGVDLRNCQNCAICVAISASYRSSRTSSMEASPRTSPTPSQTPGREEIIRVAIAANAPRIHHAIPRRLRHARRRARRAPFGG